MKKQYLNVWKMVSEYVEKQYLNLWKKQYLIIWKKNSTSQTLLHHEIIIPNYWKPWNPSTFSIVCDISNVWINPLQFYWGHYEAQ